MASTWQIHRETFVYRSVQAYSPNAPRFPDKSYVCPFFHRREKNEATTRAAATATATTDKWLRFWKRHFSSTITARHTAETSNSTERINIMVVDVFLRTQRRSAFYSVYYYYSRDAESHAIHLHLHNLMRECVTHTHRMSNAEQNVPLTSFGCPKLTQCQMVRNAIFCIHRNANVPFLLWLFRSNFNRCQSRSRSRSRSQYKYCSFKFGWHKTRQDMRGDWSMCANLMALKRIRNFLSHSVDATHTTYERP